MWEAITSLCRVGHPDAAEAVTTGLEQGTQVALETRVPELLEEAALDHVDSQGRGVDPHMPESDHGKLIAPVHGDTDAEEKGEELVPAVLLHWTKEFGREIVCVCV